jgi:hypothetical protein
MNNKNRNKNRNKNKKIKLNTKKVEIKTKKRSTQRFKIKIRKTLKIRKTFKKNKNTNKKGGDGVNSTYEGGEAFARGGFGCLFRPALKCKTSEPPPNYVSKLSLKEDAEREYDYISNIKKRLENLPKDVKDYLLLYNIEMCDPNPLTEEDKKNMDTICEKNLKRINVKDSIQTISSANINNNLEKFKILNMPQLGMDMNVFIKQKNLSPSDLININNIIIEYISIVIPNLFKRGVVHGDIKSENMMFKLNDTTMPVLIDWGLSFTADEGSKEVPKALYSLATQWHHPFSSFLFRTSLIEEYNIFVEKLTENGVEVTRDTILPYALSIYSNFITRHSSQFMSLYEIFYNMYMENFMKYFNKNEILNDENLIMYNITLNYIIQYILDVLIAYTINYKLDLGRFFNEVYIKNADIWGVISLYYDLFQKKRENFNLTDKEYKIYMNMVLNVMLENVFKNGNKVIDVTKLATDIKKLNTYLMGIKSKKIMGMKPQLPPRVNDLFRPVTI